MKTNDLRKQMQKQANEQIQTQELEPKVQALSSQLEELNDRLYNIRTELMTLPTKQMHDEQHRLWKILAVAAIVLLVFLLVMLAGQHHQIGSLQSQMTALSQQQMSLQETNQQLSLSLTEKNAEIEQLLKWVRK